MKKLENKVAIVTGGASGMGKAIAVRYAEEGAKVVVSDMNLEQAKQTVTEIEQNGGTAIAVFANVTSEKDIEKLFEETLTCFGTIDILVNNAGIMDNMAAVSDVSDEIWYRLLEVNTTSVMRTTRKVIPLFLAQKSGVILNIASVGGFRGGNAGAAYTASKHAVIGLTKNTGFQYAKEGIRCNAIAPGAVRTNITTSMTNINQKGAEICRSGMSLIPRIGNPEEIAAAALFLASDDSSFVNGEVLTVDGGQTAY